MVLWGLSNTFNKILLSNLDPIDLAALSYCLAAVFLFAVRYSPLQTLLLTLTNTDHDLENFMNKKDYVILFITALLGTVVAPLLYLNGLNLTTAVNASLLLIVSILFVIIIGILFLKEHINRKDSFAFLFITVGTIFLVTNGQPENFSISLDLGSLLIIGAAFFWSIDTTLSKLLSYKGDIILITALKSLIGGLLLLLISLCINLNIPVQLENIAYLIFVSIFSIGAGLILIYLAIRIIGATRTGSLFSLSALFGAVFAFLILKEPFTIMQLFFGLLMLSGVLIFYLNSEDS
ncbi:MAG: EamA family transporter [Methanobacteriales archaeon Met13]